MFDSSRKMANLVAIVAGSFLLVVGFLGFRAFPLSFLAFLALLSFPRQQTRDVEQVRADPISSPSVGAIAAQCALVLNGHVAHRSFPSCSPEYTFGFVKSFVSLIALPFVPLLLAVTSTLVPPPQLVSDLTRSSSPWLLFVSQLPSGRTCRMLLSSGVGVPARRHLANGGSQHPT